MRVLVLTTLLLCGTFGFWATGLCGLAGSSDSDPKRQGAQLDSSGGVHHISKSEAARIAKKFMLNEHSEFVHNLNLRKPNIVEDDWFEDTWNISYPTKIWFRLKTGLKWSVVRVHKMTGKASYGGEGPS